MSKLLIKNATIVLLDKLLFNHSLLCENGKITQISKNDVLNMRFDEEVDASGNFLAPGFIDMHIHGMHEFLIDDGPADLKTVCNLLPRYGVTSFLPTVCPLPPGKDAAFLGQLSKTQPCGAEVLGFHLEGPFLAKTGALPPEALGKSDINRVRALIEAAKPYPAIFSISPDFENVCDLIPLMAQDNRPVFITHTAANVKQTQAALKAGACHATHFYDVFPCPAESDPGVRPCGAVEAILADERASVDFILDGEHVEPVAVQMALACKGPDRVCLITDANKGAGLAPGRYKALGTEIEFRYQGAPARMTENTNYPGALAGSGLTMDQAVRNAVKMLGVEVPQAIRMASANCAQVLRLKSKGQIKEGFDADLVLLDQNLNVIKTWIGQNCCFGKN